MISPRKRELLEAHAIRWEFGLNDMTLAGWATVAGYGAAAVLAWRAAGRGADRGEALAWRIIAAVLVLLAINKQLDLHVLVTDIGRWWSVQADWYQHRRAFQKAVMLMGAALAAAALVAGFVLTRGRDPALRLALLALAICGGYILIRAASFHHADVLLRTEVFGLRWNWAIELAGIAVTLLAAMRYRRR